jgi:hypothetical protein
MFFTTPIYIFFFLILWIFIHIPVTNDSDVRDITKRDRNKISGIHAIVTVICYFINFTGCNQYNPIISHQYFMYWSVSYYIIDIFTGLITLLRNKLNTVCNRSKDNNKISIVDFTLILHHFITIGSLLHISPQNWFVYHFLFLMEISNLPMYIAYDRKCDNKNPIGFLSDNNNNKNNSNQFPLTKKLLLTEVIFYGGFRLIGGSILLYYSFMDMNLYLKISTFLIYFMSFNWTVKLIKQYMRMVC